MIERTEQEVTEFLNALYNDESRAYNNTSIKATKTRTGWRIELKRMYEYFPLGFNKLCAISEFFGTQNIEDSRLSYDGCETCDYGSSYEVTIEVEP